MKTKSFISKMAVSLMLSVLLSGTASAAANFGRVWLFDLNATVPGRDACIQQTPALPASGGWACIYNNNPLRSQISTMLREAYEQRKSCWVGWQKISPNGDAIITSVQCL